MKQGQLLKQRLLKLKSNLFTLPNKLGAQRETLIYCCHSRDIYINRGEKKTKKKNPNWFTFHSAILCKVQLHFLQTSFNQFIGFSDLVDLWVIEIKSPWSFAHVVSQDHVNRARNSDQAARTCERFVYSTVKITRVYDYQTWPTHSRGAQRCVGFFLSWQTPIVWKARSLNSTVVWLLLSYFGRFSFGC